MTEISDNLGIRPARPLPAACFPDVGAVLAGLPTEARPAGSVDVLLVNLPRPTAPSGSAVSTGWAAVVARI